MRRLWDGLASQTTPEMPNFDHYRERGTVARVLLLHACTTCTCSAIVGTVMDQLCMASTVTVCDSVLDMGRGERGGEEEGGLLALLIPNRYAQSCKCLGYMALKFKHMTFHVVVYSLAHQSS